MPYLSNPRTDDEEFSDPRAVGGGQAGRVDLARRGQPGAAVVAGRRACDLARAGQEVTLQPRRVRVDAINVLSFAYPHLELEIHCGKGTYIRSLARDLGERLGCGALVATLRRTRVGHFTVENAI